MHTIKKITGFLTNKIVLSVVIFVLLVGAFALGRVSGALSQSYKAQVTEVTNKDATSTANVDFALFWKVWSTLNSKYVATHASTTDSTQDRVYGAIKGMVASLGDPYTVFFPPADSEIFKSEISGNFEGIGLEVGMKDGSLIAVTPLKGSPAEKAGIKTGDYILKIDGATTDGLSIDASVKKIRGKKGTSVTLTLYRSDKTGTFDVTIVRDTINLPTVDTEARKDGIFVLKLYTFSENSPDLFRNALKQFVTSGDHKLILDLRGNPGGYLDAAVDMASWFLPAGDIVVKEDYGKDKPGDEFKSRGYNIFNNNLKMIILVNGGSASASEILSGALKEHGVAQLVGEKTFGKGSVQELIPLDNNSALKVTVARWLTPNGLSISDHGITPDVVVKMTAEDIKAGKDPQMDRAIEILKKAN